MNTIIYLDVPVLIMKDEVYYHALVYQYQHTYVKKIVCTNDITQLIQDWKIEIVLKKVKQPPGNS